MNDRVFIIDLARCIGCGTCSVACKDRAGLPDEVDLLQIETTESGAYPAPDVTHRVVHCFHCAHAPCVDACPVEALTHTADGFVELDKEACTGCGRCEETCPFAAVTVLPEGIAVKCDGCADELAAGIEPTCVRACPMRALSYAPVPEPLPTGRVRAVETRGQGAAPRVCYLQRTTARANAAPCE
jgi:anaerobic dimethyl sulfoxide reductase subunit B (iron-sulfur subunit)